MRTFQGVVFASNVLLILVLAAGTAEAGPITCTGVTSNDKVGTALLNSALTCTGTGTFGEAGKGNDSAGHLNGLGVFGTGWEKVGASPVSAQSYLGSFAFDPAAFASLCSAGPCTDYIVALKWDGLVAYFSLGSLANAVTLNWEVTRFALSHINIYGRFNSDPSLPQVPEPGTLALVATGLVAAGRAVRRRRRPAADSVR